jgi:hypothetical protein
MCICRKDSVDEIYQKITNFDHQLIFTKPRMLENEIDEFLDCKIFIKNSKIKFRETCKKGLETIFTNY